MKQMWNSILQTVIQFVKSLFVNVSGKMQRSAVLMTAGISVVTVLTLTAGDLQGSGRNALVAFAETPEQREGVETELEEADSNESVTDKEEHNEQTETEAENTEKAEPETADVPASDDCVDEDVDTRIEGLAEREKFEKDPEESEPEKDENTEEEIVLSDSEYNVLLKIVQAEAGGCDEKGRILVANVILNRVESDEFPDTVSEVVYQKCQFSPVSNGTINTCKVTKKTIDAVNRALEGEDYSEGALYFMNRSRSSSRNVHWFDANLDYLFKHGDHEFFK